MSADEIVAEVQANAESECLPPAGVDELFCNEVDFDAITFEDGLLTVPTALEGSAPTALPDGGGIVIRPAATAGAPDEPGAPVLVRGHFDDPEARTCQRLAIGVLPVGVANTILWCRTQFVATEF